MNEEKIYKNLIKELFNKTYGKFEHDEIKAIELFDKLIDKGITSHCDLIKKFCLDVGYDKYASNEISNIYDFVCFYKKYKSSTISYWDNKKNLGE